MGPVVTYIHADGMKAGFYFTVGDTPCVASTMPTSDGYEAADAVWAATMGFDFLKYDGLQCNGFSSGAYGPAGVTYGQSAVAQYVTQNMAIAVRASGRPMIYSVSANGIYGSLTWGTSAGANMLRTSGDLVYPGVPNFANVMTELEAQVGLAGTASIGHWNDPDRLGVGNGTLTDIEGATQMSMWSILAAPLLIGADIRSASAATLTTLENSDVIAVDQDAAGITGVRVSSTACGSSVCEVWVKQLTGTNTCAIALLNQDSAAHNITATFATIAGTVPGCGSGPYTTTRDLWAHSTLGTLTTSYTATAVPAHGTFMFRVAP